MVNGELIFEDGFLFHFFSTNETFSTHVISIFTPFQQQFFFDIWSMLFHKTMKRPRKPTN